MKYLCRPIFLLFFLALLFTGCQKAAKVERTMENGVEVVINHLEPYKLPGVPSSLTLSEVFSIDTEKEALAAKGLLSISSLALDSAGNIFIGQRPKGGNAIFKFDTHGNFVSSFGREGQGPGEFQSAPGILFDDEDHLIAQDASTQGVIVFDKDGKFLQIVKGQRDVSPDRLLKTKRYLVEWQVQDVEKGVLRNYYAQADKALKDIRELHHFECGRPRPVLLAIVPLGAGSL